MDIENRIIASIYDAALDASQWTSVIENIVNYTESKTAIFTALDQFNPTFNFLHTYNIPPESVDAYRDENIKTIDMRLHMHLWTSIGLGNTVIQDCAHYSQHPDTDEFVFYEKCLKPTGVSYLAGVLLDRGDYRWAVLGIHRDIHQGIFQDKEMQFLQKISIHLRRALQIHKQVSVLELEKFNAYQALSRLKIGVILLDGRHQIKFSNSTAESIIAKNSEFEIDQSHQLKLGRDYQAKFTQLLHSSCIAQDVEAIGGVMRVQDQKGHSVMLTIVPFRSNTLDCAVLASHETVIYLTDQYQRHILSQSYLIQSYKLTKREIDLCEALINGDTPEQIAQRHQLSIHSIRSYMKNIYEKVNVKSQIELIHILHQCTLPFQHLTDSDPIN